MKKILFYQWYSFMNPGIEKAFKQLEIQYDILYYQQTDWEEDAIFEEKIEKQIQDNVYDAVFSVNFAPVISKVCQHRGIRYISWVYDSPMHIRNIEVMKNSCNEIYMFDWGQVQEYKKLGVNMEHLPLAVDSEIFNLPMNDEIIKKYSAQISLVGKMYTTDYPKYTSPLSTETKKLLNDMISSQRDVYNDCFIPELLTDELLQKINAEYAKAGLDFYIEKRELEYMMLCETTSRERTVILSLLSKHFDTHLYTTEKPGIDNLKVHGPVDYYKQMPYIFKLSDINLNISLKSIRTGIPLRCVDVLGCGGFLLSNYQEELVQYLEVGKDCEVYGSFEEMYEKAAFYTKHEELRKQIARNGFMKAQEIFTFRNRIEQMI
ncbi:glycosyltransferase family protein [Agathobacter sp.]|mgnify:FL=1|uniref:glycosyltransferase family protein n=1 Tax=Agathobacter sp. TaxID=2021311 RepID=UPI003AB7F638